jgi:hypothetical protein
MASSEKAEWYLLVEGQKKRGPFTRSELQDLKEELLQCKGVRIRRDTGNNWVAWDSAGQEFPELQDLGTIHPSLRKGYRKKKRNEKCWFFDDEVAEEDCAIEVTMYADVQKSLMPGDEPVEWRQSTIKVPRSLKAAGVHKKLRPVGFLSGLVIGIGGIPSFFLIVDMGPLWQQLLWGLLVGLIGGSVLGGTLIFIGGLVLPLLTGVKSESATKRYPRIIELQQKG